MNHLFLIDRRTMAMDDRQDLNSGFRSAKNFDMLGKIKPVFFQYFEPVVDDCCMRIDLEFGVQLGKNREKFSKDQYIKLLEYLRSIRKELKQNYLLKINAIFDDSYQKKLTNPAGVVDFSKVSLSSDAMVKENHAVAQIISDCEHLFYEELSSFNKHVALSQGKQTIADSQSPIFPEKLMRGLVDVVNPLKLTTDGKIALYKSFEANVFSQLGFIYRELIKCCEISVPQQLYLVGEIKEKVESTFASTEQPGTEFGVLQKKLGLWRWSHTPSAYDLVPVSNNAFYEHFEIKNALQILQQFNEDLEPGEKSQLKWQVLKKLKELSFTDKVKNLAQQDEDVLDLVALIFSEIKQDESLQEAVKSDILQMALPLAATCLGRYSIFTTQDNPVRQLIDDIFAAGQFLNLAEHDDRLILQRIASAVKKMTKESGFELSGWIAEAKEFSTYLNQQQQRSQNAEQHVKQLLKDQLTLESSKKIVANVIENSIRDKAMPTAIVDFLRNVWSDVLLDVNRLKDEQPEMWTKTVQAMDELIISVIPPADDDQRKQILKLLPGLILELRKGLKQIAYDKSAQSRFFKDLAVWHIILMDKKEAKKTLVDTVNNAVIAEQVNALADDNSEQVKNLALESWLSLTSESTRQWAKLIWIDSLEKLIFVGKNGMIMFELQAIDLAEKFRLGQAVVVKVNQKTITERVLSKLRDL